MKKKKLISVICSVLTAVMLLLTFIPAMAQVQNTCNCGNTPIVYVHGVGDNLYKNPGTDEQEIIFPPSSDAIMAQLSAKNVTSLLFAVSVRDWDKIGSILSEVAYNLMGDIQCNSDGSVPEGTGVNWTYGNITTHGRDSVFNFSYDWRLDPCVIAEQLNDYLDYVSEKTGHNTFYIEGFSMGAAVTLAYLEKYGDERIEGFMSYSGAVNGADCCGEPFNMEFSFDADSLINYLDGMLGGDTKELANVLLELFKKCGALDCTLDFVEELIEREGDKVYNSVLGPVFLTMPGLWALVPDKYYESAKDAFLTGKEEYTDLCELIDNYHYNVQCKNTEIIDSFIADGNKFGIIGKYNFQGFPIIKSIDNQTDTVMDLKYCTFGATAAPYGKTLGEDYVQAVNDGHNHLSPDGIIDASTGRYPEQTWFIRDVPHSIDPHCIDIFVRDFFRYAGNADVRTFAQYPQFVLFDSETETLVPMTDDNATIEKRPERSCFELLTALFRMLGNYIKQYFAAKTAA